MAFFALKEDQRRAFLSGRNAFAGLEPIGRLEPAKEHLIGLLECDKKDGWAQSTSSFASTLHPIGSFLDAYVK